MCEEADGTHSRTSLQTFELWQHGTTAVAKSAASLAVARCGFRNQQAVHYVRTVKRTFNRQSQLLGYKDFASSLSGCGSILMTWIGFLFWCLVHKYSETENNTFKNKIKCNKCCVSTVNTPCLFCLQHLVPFSDRLLCNSISPSISLGSNYSSLLSVTRSSQYSQADLCVSPSSPSSRCPSAGWSSPTLCPFWPSEVAARLLSPWPPPVQLLALNAGVGEEQQHTEGEQGRWTEKERSGREIQATRNKLEIWIKRKKFMLYIS